MINWLLSPFRMQLQNIVLPFKAYMDQIYKIFSTAAKIIRVWQCSFCILRFLKLSHSKNYFNKNT